MYSPEDKILSKNIFLNKIFCVWNIEDILFKISSLGIWSTPRKLSACSITKKKCIQSINFYSHRKILFPSRGNPTSRVFHFSFLNRNQIVYIIFQLIWNQTERYISVKMYMHIKKYFKCISLYIHILTEIYFFVWSQINRKIVNTIWFRFDLIRIRKDFSVSRAFQILRTISELRASITKRNTSRAFIFLFSSKNIAPIAPKNYVLSVSLFLFECYTQGNNSETLLNQTEIKLYLPFSYWFVKAKQTVSVCCSKSIGAW